MKTFKDEYGRLCVAVEVPNEGRKNNLRNRYKIFISDDNEVFFILEEYHDKRQSMWGPSEGWHSVKKGHSEDYSVLPSEAVIAAAKLLKLNSMK